MTDATMAAIDELRTDYGKAHHGRSPTRGAMLRILAVKAFRDLEARRGVPSKGVEASANEQTPVEATARPSSVVLERASAVHGVERIEHHGDYEASRPPSAIQYDPAIIESGILS